MKRIHIISLSFAITLIFVWGLLFVFSGKNEETNQKTLAENQEVIKNEQVENVKKEIIISPEKQQQLDEIKSIYSASEVAHRDTVANIMRKYNSNFSGEDQESLLKILEENTSRKGFTQAAKSQLGMSFLQADVQAMLTSWSNLSAEKTLEGTRLELFREKNLSDLQNNSQKLFELTLNSTLQKNTNLSSTIIILGTLTLALTSLGSLTQDNIDTIISLFMWELSELEILLEPTSGNQIDSLSYVWNVPIFEKFQKLDFSLITRAHANDDDAELSSEEKSILVLKTQVLIEKILRESIDNEIQYNKNEITKSLYETNIQNNLLKLEELVIFKNSLESDSDIISMDDIQRFNLWGYVDDSEEIENLPVLAYIQEKTGPIIVYNLNGSTKLGEENISLYSWYGIETLWNSHATLVFSDESVLRLEPLSRVNISALSSSNINVSVEQWSIWTRVLKPLLSGDVFTIESGGIGLGVRGTALSVIKRPDDSIKVNIVDSYTSNGESSVTLTNSSSVQTPLDAGKEVLVNSDGDVSLNDRSKLQLFTQEPQTTDFVREDLSYMSLLLSDRSRGFYNTPFSSKNDSDAFLNKISWELEVSLPSLWETPYIIQNNELVWESVNSGSIYHLMKKDIIISAIKNNPIGNTANKVQSVRNLDMLALQQELWNMREIENRFNYNIIKNITTQSDFTPEQLKNIFINFPLTQAQEDSRILQEVKQNLSINNGSNIVTENISLPLSVSWVSITWETSLPSVVSQTGEVAIQDVNTSVILTASLEKWNLRTTKDFYLNVVARELSEVDKLENAWDILTNYIENVAWKRFNTHIFTNPDIPNFWEDWGIIPIINWSGSPLINADGSTNKPSFLAPLLEQYEYTNITATLEHPLQPNIQLTKQYSNIWIQKKEIIEDITDDEDIEIETPQVLIADTQFPGCNIPDIILSNGQIWSMCNAGSSVSGMSSSSYGNYYKLRNGDATDACNINGYRTPTRNDWIQAFDSFSNDYSEMESTLSLSKAGYKDKSWTGWKDKEIWSKWYFWTSESKSTCLSNCWYGFSNWNIVSMESRTNKLSVRCIREVTAPEVVEPVTPPVVEPVTPSPEELANDTLQAYKQTLENYFLDEKIIVTSVTNIKNVSGFPPTPASVSIVWNNGTSEVQPDWDIEHPSFNTWDRSKVLQATLSHPDTSTTQTATGLKVKVIRLACNGADEEIIDGECYELVANAEYNNNYNLWSLSPTNTSNPPPLVQEGGQKWVKLLSSQGHSLSYDISSLNLWDDWAIEMSVRGGDLKRISPRYYLFSSPWNFTINTFQNKLRVLAPWVTKDSDVSTVNSMYHKILFTDNKLYINNIEKINHSIVIWNDIIIGTDRNYSQAWNWVINSLKIYKLNF